MSIELSVHRKYKRFAPIEGYDTGCTDGYHWVFDKDLNRQVYFREEREMREYFEQLCNKAWEAAIDCCMIELRLLRKDKSRS